MGAFISSPIATLQWLLSESTRILEIATIIVSMTSVVVTTYTTNFKERAEAQISMVFTDVEDFLSELSTHGEVAQKCIDNKKRELITLRNQLVIQLIECYQSHEKIFSQLQEGREKLHIEALKIKSYAEDLVENCIEDRESRTTCLSQGLSKLKRQVQRLMKQSEVHARKELLQRRKVLLSLVKCDRRAVERAYRAVQSVVQDVKKCIFEKQTPTILYSAVQE